VRLRLRMETLTITTRPTRIMSTQLLRCFLSALPALMFVTPALSQSPATSSDPATLAPGDSVRVVVWRKPEMSGDFIVGADGTITHPLYRSVQVGGVPFRTAEANVRNFLARFEQDPQFVLEPLVRVSVLGEVGRPQVFAVRPETSVAEAVAQAGGLTQNAKRDQVRVLRREANGVQREFVVNILEPDVAARRVRVHSGDQILVDRRTSFFRDILLPTLTVIGSAASIYLLIDRAQTN
jgi:polysaccharide export outer membrane protein